MEAGLHRRSVFHISASLYSTTSCGTQIFVKNTIYKLQTGVVCLELRFVYCILSTIIVE